MSRSFVTYSINTPIVAVPVVRLPTVQGDVSKADRRDVEDAVSYKSIYVE